MKKIFLVLGFLFISCAISAQHFHKRPKSISFQVAPSVFSYDGNTVFGYQIGLSVKSRFQVSYFAMRDYDFSDSVKDYGWRGFVFSYMFPVNDKIQLGPVARLANINGDWEKPYFGAELSYGLTDQWKLGLEYGRSKNEVSNHVGFGMKLVYYMY